MTVSLLLPLATASLRRRWSGFIGSFVALTLGVALLAAVGMMLSSAAGTEVDPQGPSLYKLLIFATGASAVISVFVVANTFAFAVAQRRRETALLRALGATPVQVRLLVLGEAVLVSLLASVAGCLAALALAPGFASWLVSSDIAPKGFAAHPSLTPLPVAVAVCVVVALAGAAAASQRAVAVRPVEALQDAAVDTRRYFTPAKALIIFHHLGGCVLLTLLYLANPVALLHDPGMRGPEIKLTWAMIFSLMLVSTVVLFAPLLVPPLVRLLTLPFGLLRGGATGLLARQNALTSARRTVSTAIPTFIVVATAGCVAGGILAFGNAWGTDQRAHLNASFVAPASGAALPARSVAALRAVPGVKVTAVTPFQLDDPVAHYPAGDDRMDVAAGPVTADAVDGDPATAWNLRFAQGTWDNSTPDAAAVTTDLARAHGWHVGDRVGGTLPDGSAVTFRLAAFYRPLPGFPELLLSATPAAGHLTPAAGASTSAPAPGTGAAAYLTAPAGTTAATLAQASGGLPVIPAQTWVDTELASQAHFDRLTMIAIAGPGLLYALLAIANTMIMSTRDRKRDFATLRLAGSTHRQVLRMVALESTLVVGVATLLGLAVTALFQFATTEYLINHDVLGSGLHIGLSLPWPQLGIAAAACLVLALLASDLPARYNLRTRQAD